MKWTKEQVIKFVQDEESIEILVTLLTEHGQAKQVLRDKGYGWTGLNLVKTCEMVPENG